MHPNKLLGVLIYAFFMEIFRMLLCSMMWRTYATHLKVVIKKSSYFYVFISMLSSSMAAGAAASSKSMDGRSMLSSSIFNYAKFELVQVETKGELSFNNFSFL